MKRHRFYKYFLTAFTAAVIALSVTFFSFALSRVEHEKALAMYSGAAMCRRYVEIYERLCAGRC